MASVSSELCAHRENSKFTTQHSGKHQTSTTNLQINAILGIGAGDCGHGSLSSSFGFLFSFSFSLSSSFSFFLFSLLAAAIEATMEIKIMPATTRSEMEVGTSI